MSRLAAASLLVALGVVIVPSAHSQDVGRKNGERQLIVDVIGKASDAGKSINVSFDNRTMTVVFDTAGRARGRLTVPAGSLTEATFKAEMVGYTTHRERVTLNGSNHVEWDLSTGVAQWPLITWNSSGGNLDIELDGSSVGSTSLSRTVKPGAHVFVWRSGGAIVCTRADTLLANSRKTLTCNTVTKAVSNGV